MYQILIKKIGIYLKKIFVLPNNSNIFLKALKHIFLKKISFEPSLAKLLMPAWKERMTAPILLYMYMFSG
jgi:hypothetical protein